MTRLLGRQRAVLRAQVTRPDERFVDRHVGRQVADRGMLTGDHAAVLGILQHRCRQVAGQHVLLADPVVGQVVSHTANDRVAAKVPGQHRHLLANLHPGHRRVDRTEFAAELGGSLGLQIEGVLVRRSAFEEDEDRRAQATVGLARGL